MSALDDLLQTYRDVAVTERGKGTYLERLDCAYLTADPVQAEEYVEVWSWSDWAAQNGWNGKDVGVDLVAKLFNEEGFAAVQCKFYAAKHRIQKADIDSFISASGKASFVRRVVIDTTEVSLGSAPPAPPTRPSASASTSIIGQAQRPPAIIFHTCITLAVSRAFGMIRRQKPMETSRRSSAMPSSRNTARPFGRHSQITSRSQRWRCR